MAPPVVTAVTPTTAEPRQQLLVTGTNFGFVSGAFFENATSHELFAGGFTQVFDSQHALVTVPPDIAVDLDYFLVLVTLEDEVSTNSAGTVHVQPISGNYPSPTPIPTPDPLPLPVDGSSVGLDRIRKRTRLELADPKTPFQAQSTGDGETTRFNLPVRHVDSSGLVVTRVPTGGDMDDAVTLTDDDYVIDAFTGELILNAPLGDGDRIFVTGHRHRFFDDDTLDVFIETAFAQIAHGRTITTETLNQYGYRQYSYYGYTYDTVPEVEILPLAILAKIEALWVLATDASYDVDISADGAGIPRSERYRQIMGQIQAETARFNDMAEALNIGLHRIEMATLRRVSRMTGRLVPVYVEKEYDDHNLPVRALPGVDHGVGEGQEFVDPFYQAGADYGGGFGP